MKNLFTSIIVIFPLTINAATDQEMIIESQAAIKDFSTRLKKELQQGTKNEGPVAAIQICNNVAAGISNQVSQQYGWNIARTSLKVRNPNNAPDQWETRILKSFQNRRVNGEDPKNMKFAQVIDKDGQKTFRYIQAIPTGGVCLACHGEQIAPEVSLKLQQLYPLDQATGFKIGDIRGAFTVSRKVD
jgi:hypothetical protein